MPRLAEIIQRLAQARAAVRPPPPGETRLRAIDAFGDDPGGLRMFAYAPPGLAPGAPLLVVLHGCTQSAAGYDDAAGWSRLADEHGFALVLPEQRRENNPRLCFNWFEPEHVARGSGEVASIRSMVAHAVAAYGADPDRVFVTGLSAGGAMTAALLAAYPEVFAGGAIIAGLPAGAARDVPSALKAMRDGVIRPPARWGGLVRAAAPPPARWPRVAIWHGDADAVVRLVNAGELVKQWTDVHGVAHATPQIDEIDGAARRVWRGPDGVALVEEVVVPGLGHGAPLDTAVGAPGRGRAAPFMLEAGISSTWRIAQSFGLAEARPSSVRETTRPRAEPAPREAPASDRGAEPRRGFDVAGVIEASLRRAGLLRS
jgi:feruloyl esterase